MLANLDLSAITDENARILIQQLLNLIEQLAADLREAQAENQRLRDELNRLKGEQGKPDIKGNTPPKRPPHSIRRKLNGGSRAPVRNGASKPPSTLTASKC